MGVVLRMVVPARCSGGNLGPDPQDGYICENPDRVYWPTFGQPNSSFYNTDTYFVAGSTKLYVDGQFIPTDRYVEYPSSKLIEIFSNVPVGGGAVYDPPKVVYLCYWSTPNLITNAEA
jgi:hypothetical protein